VAWVLLIQPIFPDGRRFSDGFAMLKSVDICDQSILITGGTGSFGKAFVRAVLDHCPKIKRLVVYSRDELKQFEMQQEFPQDQYPALRFFIGDVRDPGRLARAMEGIDTVVHAAALKQVPAAEYNPFEFINLYGATKLCSDKLFIAANNFRGDRELRFSVVRYGNVMGSRGSVIPFFMNKAKTGVLPITDKAMTRFNIPLEEGVEMVFWALEHALGGEILVPKIPSYRIADVAEAVGPNCKQEIVGIRPGEKLHEEMITSSDSPNTLDLGSYYAILGSSQQNQKFDYLKTLKAQQVPHGFAYESGSNPDFLSVEEIRSLIKTHMNPEFEPV